MTLPILLEAFEEVGLPPSPTIVKYLTTLRPFVARSLQLVTPIVCLILDHNLQVNLPSTPYYQPDENELLIKGFRHVISNPTAQSEPNRSFTNFLLTSPFLPPRRPSHPLLLSSSVLPSSSLPLLHPPNPLRVDKTLPHFNGLSVVRG